jgi:type II secretory pathway component PulF
MVGQGVDLLQGLAIAQRGIHQERLLIDLRHVREDVRSGLNFSQALARYPFFVGPFLRMIQIGEETGRLPETLQQVSQLYRKESQERLTFLMSVLEPLCLSLLGLLLGWIIMATFMPLYDSLHFVEDAY